MDTTIFHPDFPPYRTVEADGRQRPAFFEPHARFRELTVAVLGSVALMASGCSGSSGEPERTSQPTPSVVAMPSATETGPATIAFPTIPAAQPDYSRALYGSSISEFPVTDFSENSNQQYIAETRAWIASLHDGDLLCVSYKDGVILRDAQTGKDTRDMAEFQSTLAYRGMVHPDFARQINQEAYTPEAGITFYYQFIFVEKSDVPDTLFIVAADLLEQVPANGVFPADHPCVMPQ